MAIGSRLKGKLLGSGEKTPQHADKDGSKDPAVNVEDIDEVDGEGQNMILGIISQLRPGCDLSRITLPTFILERKSMLERITNILQHPQYLLEAHEQEDPIERFKLVVKWYLSGWHISPKAVKKPLNPVLGEYFTCYWDLPNNTQAYYVAEQTSHHPPESSYFYISPENAIRIDGALVPRSRFLGNSVASMMEGVGYLKFLDRVDPETGLPETYSITQPNMYARNILIGRLKFELGDHAVVSCPALDLEADIEFKTKGFISGTYNAVSGTISKISTGEVLYEITGKWNEVMEIKDRKTGEQTEFFNAYNAEPIPPKVRPIEEQGEFESRRLWRKVIEALGERNHTVATEEKFKIEEQQRRDARKREEDGVEFYPKLFRAIHGPNDTTTKPNEDPKLDYHIYKHIDYRGNSPEAIQHMKEQIFQIAPFLPGQEFHESFEIPAYKKHEQAEAERNAQNSSADEVAEKLEETHLA